MFSIEGFISVTAYSCAVKDKWHSGFRKLWQIWKYWWDSAITPFLQGLCSKSLFSFSGCLASEQESFSLPARKQADFYNTFYYSLASETSNRCALSILGIRVQLTVIYKLQHMMFRIHLDTLFIFEGSGQPSKLNEWLYVIWGREVLFFFCYAK